MLSTEEQRQKAVWDDISAHDDASVFLPELFEQQAARSPDATAVSIEGRTLTYGDLSRRTSKLASRLRGLGVGPEVLVGVCVERSIEMLVGLLGILKAGGAYVPLDPDYPRGRFSLILEDTRAGLVLTQSHLLDSLGSYSGRVLCLDSDWERIEREPGENLSVRTEPAQLAYVIYTSGSTGRPKGVMVEHRGLRNRLLWMADRYAVTPADRVLQKTPFSFDVSAWEFFLPLVSGAQLVMARPGGQREADYLIRLIQREGITITHFVPSMLQAFLETLGQSKLPSLRHVFCSGEALNLSLQQRFFSKLGDIALHNLYGPTEASIDASFWACDPDTRLASVPIGRPIWNTQLYVLDERLRVLPAGDVGELYIGGDGLARGYLNRPGLTAERFIPNPFRAADGRHRLYKTGDQCRYLADGSIDYVGRLDDQVKLRGHRIELGEIELALQTHPQVMSAAVSLRADGLLSQRIVAYVVPRGSMPSGRDLRNFLSESLPEYMLPHEFVPLDAMPLTLSGKLDRRALPDPPPRRITNTPPSRQPTSLERTIASVWEETLGVSQVGVFDQFFELGGNSLLMAVVRTRLRGRLNRDIPTTELFKYPTVHALADYLRRDAPDESQDRTVHHARMQKQALARIRNQHARRD